MKMQTMAEVPIHVTTNMDYGSRITLEQARRQRSRAAGGVCPVACGVALLAQLTACFRPLLAVRDLGRQRCSEAGAHQHRRDRGASAEAAQGGDGNDLMFLFAIVSSRSAPAGSAAAEARAFSKNRSIVMGSSGVSCVIPGGGGHCVGGSDAGQPSEKTSCSQEVNHHQRPCCLAALLPSNCATPFFQNSAVRPPGQ